MSIPTAFQHLVDDAAIFPPGLAPLPDAVVAHDEHLRSDHADLVGPFVVDTSRLDALAGLPGAAGLRVSVVVPSVEALPLVVTRCDEAGLVLAGLEVKLTGRDGEVAEVAAAAPLAVPTYVEVPRPTSPAWSGVLDEVVTHGLRLKFRTGGTEAAAFPSEAELATWITEAVAHGVPFKCTAGLHHATRHTGATTGFEHHGYLNVLLATARAAEGGDVAGALAERDPQALADAVSWLTEGQLTRARAAFSSYGSCSILEPLDDLTTLRLIPTPEETA
jgi:hypothetical protein